MTQQLINAVGMVSICDFTFIAYRKLYTLRSTYMPVDMGNFVYLINFPLSIGKYFLVAEV